VRVLVRASALVCACALPAAAFASFAGCSDGTKPTPPPLTVRDDDAATKDTGPVDPPDSALPKTDSGSPSGSIYVQTGRNLALYEPYSKSLRAIGPFTCLAADEYMLDIAVDRDGNIYGTTELDRFVRIDPANGSCRMVRQGSGLDYPVLIAFVPRGTLDPANDALVGYDGESYLRIDVDTGRVTTVGSLNPPDASTNYEATGDLIYAGDDGMFLTAGPVGGSGDAGDLFLRFDPKTGKRLSLVGNTGFRRLYGLGYWGSRIFAFTTPGEILQVDPRTAKATLIRREDGGTRDASIPVFYGAGSTTVAPKTPVP
jgi:hypothetical protein